MLVNTTEFTTDSAVAVSKTEDQPVMFNSEDAGKNLIWLMDCEIIGSLQLIVNGMEIKWKISDEKNLSSKNLYLMWSYLFKIIWR